MKKTQTLKGTQTHYPVTLRWTEDGIPRWEVVERGTRTRLLGVAFQVGPRRWVGRTYSGLREEFTTKRLAVDWLRRIV